MIRRAVALVAVFAAGAGAVRVRQASRGLPEAMGAPAEVLRAAAERSPFARGGRFHNTEPAVLVDPARVLTAFAQRRRRGRPPRPVPLVTDPVPRTADPLAVTWFGHSSVLLEIDGRRVLTDPMWAERASPSPTVGPRRLHPPPLPLSALPAVDAVVISHDHYDHLDLPTIRELTAAMSAPFVVPVGIGAHLRFWGVPDDRIVELDWGQHVRIGELALHATPARHFSGRGLTRNTTQWASWVVEGPAHRVFFGGDTGYTSAFSEIGARFAPFDLTILPIGAYADLWPDVHMTPEEALRAHLDLVQGGAAPLLPVHWGTFDLAWHEWAEPVERLTRAADETGTRICVPRPGARITPDSAPELDRWWAAIT
ncbi:L-ascorbate metabolism protein UlaG, beta-lactamase superfamily [Pseudonocardia thermophila]|uniref:L-ascorbate metabolism protein UlaG, beta-lactamase superfamily n=1 Tax=Pseudonocardia thermophila TaxID=1848 RepID=A0A1M6Z0X8_PSETH|nr:MBL fold metallo-hydrolase [Pseudonocardia thermophila]SHL24087.1 L-ascorbate metabolism protein UlaG, beta-lactamase superfamily [Pseudonocardia thermophila]